VAVDVRLLGRPRASRDGRDVEVRGQKPWLLLALLLLHSGSVGRDRLARLLFTDAVDPGAALRWNLTQLRHLGVEVGGDPVQLEVPEDVVIDVEVLLRGRGRDATTLPSLDDELLAGVRAEYGSEVAVWLEDERRHLRRAALDVRHEAALVGLARGDVATALRHARRVAEASPLDENAASLLVRCLRAGGHLDDARAVAEEAAARLRGELGVEPSQALWTAAVTPPVVDRRVTGRAAVVAQLEAGEAAVAAGAVDVAVTALQGAVAGARAVGDTALLARTLVALGSALVHCVRGVDQEGLTLLHEAVPLTDQVDDRALAVLVRREIGYVGFLRGSYDRATHWFALAREASDDVGGLGWVDLYDGACADDVGDGARGLALLEGAMDTARREDDLRLQTHSWTLLGRHHLLTGDVDRAVVDLEAALTASRRLGWTAFRPFPQSLLAEAWRLRGELGRAQDLAENAYGLAEQLNDPCWEGLALRALGGVAVDGGDVDRGIRLLEDAPTQCRRLPDTYRWVELWAYDALVDTALQHDTAPRLVSRWLHHLTTEASSLGMQPLAERARGHRARVTGTG
jgi:DNA-binding SARP family transcriptional activator